MNTDAKKNNIVDEKSQAEDFFQSEQWRKFQEAVGRKTIHFEAEGFLANIVEHELPIVGKYFYCPRGPIMEHGACLPDRQAWSMEQKKSMQALIELAKKENAGWIRIEPSNKVLLQSIMENVEEKIVKAPHDMQPKEIFVIDISKSSEQLLTEMKSKTRYNIGIAKKKGVVVINDEREKFVDEFLKLTSQMAKRQGIMTHPEEHYRKMITSLPEEMLKVYVAEFEGKIIAANLVLFSGKTAIYLHGASGNLHRNLMAPFLLQWQAILDAKEKGCKYYDFGGIKTQTSADLNGLMQKNNWEGITNFKLGFSPQTKAVEFPGSYDVIINSRKYWVYRGLQAAKSFAVRFRK